MEIPYEWIPTLHDYCRDRVVYFMSTPFDERSADELPDYVPAWKVASYTSSHVPFLECLAGTDKPIVMSTGAHELSEVRHSSNPDRENRYMNRFTEGRHIRINIPDTADPDHDRYHGIEGTIEQVRTVFEELAAEYVDEMGVEYEGLAVWNQRTRWGAVHRNRI